MTRLNDRSAGNGGTALGCHVGRPRPAVPDRECWAELWSSVTLLNYPDRG
jgi:hypothetical protein